MLAILKKEINAFFSSPIGYLVIGVFLVLTSLFLWIFEGDYNILDNGFASLSDFFTLTPWILIFLIPAITMRSFSEEIKQGTLELLLTKPISTLNIILGKFFGAFILIILAIIPSIIYVFSVYSLGDPPGNLDFGSTLGSYFGLLFLIACYTAIGIFASLMSSNQIVTFIVAVFICFFLYFGFESLANFSIFNGIIQLEKAGMANHFKSISRGVIDTRDLIYFLTVTGFFIYLSFIKLKQYER